MAKIQASYKIPSRVKQGGDIGLEEWMVIFKIPTMLLDLLFLVSLKIYWILILNGLQIGWGLYEAKLGRKPTLVELQKESEKEKPYE
jgi:hypothetical protein